MKLKTWAPWAVVSVALLGGVAWRYRDKQSGIADLAKTQQQRKNGPAQVNVAKVVSYEFRHSIELVGSLESPTTAKIAPRITGRVAQMLVQEGDSVVAGQVVARLDGTDLDAEIAQRQSAVAASRARLAQAEVTQNSTITSVRSAIRSGSAAIDTAKADLDQSLNNREARLQADKALVDDAKGRVAGANATLESSKAELNATRASEANAKSKYDRYNSLLQQGFVAAQDVDDALTAYRVAQAAVVQSQKRIAAAQSALDSAQAQLQNATQSAAIDARKLEAEVKSYRAKYEQSRAGFDVASSNKSQERAYVENLSALRSDLAAQEALLRQSLAKRSDSNLVSPITGTVSLKSQDVGDVAGPSTPIVTVQQVDSLFVSVPVPVENSRDVHVGDLVKVSIEGGGAPHEARVEQVVPAADPTSRQFLIRVRVDNHDRQLKAGMYAKVTVPIGAPKIALGVAKEAVKAGSLFVINDGVAHKVKVETGDQDATMIEIKSGVSEGDQVVLLTYQPVRDGQKIVAGKDDVVNDGAPKEGGTK